MNYQSTRNSSVRVSSAQAIAQGICSDGGLFVPENFPPFTGADGASFAEKSYSGRAARIFSPYLTDFTEAEIEACVSAAYTEQKFSGGFPAPVRKFKDGISFLELWHGPTCAFKDMALQVLPHLLIRSFQKIHADKTALILVATSGDTGKAALEGFRDVKGTKVLVFYPQNGVSPLQKLQMQTQEGGNVAVCAVEGNFDDAQSGVKKIFTDPDIQKRLAGRGVMFSSANSINWGRLLPQIVYYFSAYSDLVSAGTLRWGDPFNVAVPTGNFGDILAAYYAEKMGLPVHRLICASNANNVLTEFLHTGVYNRNRRFYTTISPSMDILISSNLERLLFDLTGRDSGRVAGWMDRLARDGKYRVEEDVLSSLHRLFYAGYCDDGETREEIRRVYDAGRYLCDPHTAVASRVARRYREETGDAATPMLIVSTASPYKFSSDVLEAVSGVREPDAFTSLSRLSEFSGTPVPAPIAALQNRPVRFRAACGKEKLEEAVLAFLDRNLN